MKQLVCNVLGEIYYAAVKKDGKMSEKDRVLLTQDVLNCSVIHMMMMDEYKKNDGFAGYSYGLTDGGKATLAVYDESKYMVIRRPGVEMPKPESVEASEEAAPAEDAGNSETEENS